ncbi:MAG: Hsp20/alpha crystallin family protein [Myxococcaceae bacterium]|nr:Hsp20/alpha crystallin family protein [Myxococcaceae bacterium]
MAIIPRRQVGQLARQERVWDPFELMREMLQMDPFADLGTLLPTPSAGTFVPAFDVKESGDAFIFRADLPGVNENDVDISLTGNRLTISGKREEESREEKDRYFAYERAYGAFSRTFTLPEGVDADHVSAELKDGVLSVVIPKKPEVQPRKISLSIGGKKEAKA